MNVHKLDADCRKLAAAAWIAELNLRTAQNIGDAEAVERAAAEHQRLALASKEAHEAYEAHQQRESERHRRKMARIEARTKA